MSNSGQPVVDRRTAQLAIVHSTSIEIDPFLKQCDRIRKYTGPNHFVFRGGFWRDYRIAFVQVGMGTQRAAAGTLEMLATHAPQWVLSVGFSGGLQPELKVGDIVVGNATIDPQRTEIPMTLKMPADPARGLHVGKLLTVDQVAKSAQSKQQLGQETGALAVDMESSAVAGVCREKKVRFMAVRVISDDVDHTLPDEALTILSDRGAIQVGAAVSALFKRPSAAMDLWNLRSKANDAAGRLAQFLQGVVAQLCETL